MSVEVAGWNIGLPGWVKVMQAKGRPTNIPTSRYNGCKMKRSGFRAPLKMDFPRFFLKGKSSIATPVEGKGWDIGSPGYG